MIWIFHRTFFLNSILNIILSISSKIKHFIVNLIEFFLFLFRNTIFSHIIIYVKLLIKKSHISRINSRMILNHKSFKISFLNIVILFSSLMSIYSFILIVFIFSCKIFNRTITFTKFSSFIFSFSKFFHFIKKFLRIILNKHTSRINNLINIYSHAFFFSSINDFINMIIEISYFSKTCHSLSFNMTINIFKNILKKRITIFHYIMEHPHRTISLIVIFTNI